MGWSCAEDKEADLREALGRRLHQHRQALEPQRGEEKNQQVGLHGKPRLNLHTRRR